MAAPPDRVFAAIKEVRADEIFLFRVLTWIRRGGRPLPESILNAGDRDLLIEVALHGGFVRLAEDAPPPDRRRLRLPLSARAGELAAIAEAR
ncbi:MAG: hypothetical protein ACSLFE_01390 [Gemmatimonadaceae bacterium]